MREMTKILLSVSTVCALGAVHDARGQSSPAGTQPTPAPSQVPSPQQPPPVPTDTPAPVQPDQPGSPSPSQPGDVPSNNPSAPTSTPMTPAVPDPSAPVPADPSAPPPLPPDTTSTTTTTTTTTTIDDSDIDVGNDMYAWHEPMLSSGIGVSAILGGGVVGFTDSAMRSTTSDIGGLWDLRVAIGSHLPLALEVGYVGSATNINGLPTGNTGLLIGTTV